MFIPSYSDTSKINSYALIGNLNKVGNIASNSSFIYSQIELHKDALFSIATPENGGSASAYYASDYSNETPFITVKGKDYDGKEYEEKVNIKDVDPKNSSFIEMVALSSYLNDKGKLESMNFLSAPDYANYNQNFQKRSYFDKRDYISSLESLRDMQLKNRNYDSYMRINSQLKAISNF